MILYAMLYTVAVSSVIALGAGVAARSLRNAQRPERFVWLVAIVLAGAVPMAGLARSLAQPPAAPQAVPSGPTTLPIAEVPIAERGLVGFPVLLDVPPAPVVAVAESTVGMDAIALTLWLFASALLSIRWGIAAFRLRRRLESASRHVLSDVEVWLTPDVGPAVAGVVRPRVVVPEWLMSLPDGQRRLVVRHEHEHVRAGDPVLVALARFARVATPWNPISWLLASRLHRAVELDCDRRVLRWHPDVEGYGNTLLTVSSLHSGAPAAAAAFADSEATLRQRILAMTARPGATSIISVIGAFVVGTVLLVGVFQLPVPTIRMNVAVEPPVPAMPMAQEESTTETDQLAEEVAALQAQVLALSQVQRRSIERAEAAEGELTALIERLRAAEAAIGERSVTPTDQSRFGTITGRMVDGGTGAALARVQVFISGTGIGSLTNEQGRFVLSGVPSGEHQVVAERIGYAEARRVVSVDAGQSVTADFGLTEAAVELGGVFVRQTNGRAGAPPVVFVDLVRIQDDEYAMEHLGDLQAQGRIDRIEIINSEAAVELFGSLGAGGVISITTKQAKDERERHSLDVTPSGQPVFTPYTQRPILLNEEEVRRAVSEAYPEGLRDGGIGGTVMLFLFINTEGLVQDARIARSSGSRELDAAAMSTAAVHRFQPALNRDEAVAVWIAMPLTFIDG